VTLPDDDGEDDLPQFHRTVRMPATLWQGVKARAAEEGKTLHEVLHDALDGELGELVEALRGIGLVGEDTVPANKLVRVPLDDNLVGRINHARRRTGLPAVQLMLLCLGRHTRPVIDAGARARQV
jgi:hypothetical protein